jgi:hypothetical protein
VLRCDTGPVIAGIVVASVLLFAVVASIALLVRDVGRLHLDGKSLTDSPVDASGVSPAGMTWVGNSMSH